MGELRSDQFDETDEAAPLQPLSQSCYSGPGGTQGVGACHSGTQTCSSGTFGSCVGEVTPTAEVCNGVDDNCDGQTDEGVQITFYRDADGDSFGNLAVTTQACSVPAGYVANNTDCNDSGATIRPGATEICGDGIDQDCNGSDVVCPPPPPLAVLTPNGGEAWPISSTQTIQWNPSGVSGKVKIELSRDGGTTWTVLFNKIPNNGTQNWTVVGLAAGQALMRISSVNTPSIGDTSNAVFTISGGSVTVIAPNGGETWSIGSMRTIQWSSNGLSGNVKIELSRDGGTTWTVLSKNVANTGSQTWKVAKPATIQARIRVSGVSDPGAVDISNTNFTIQQ